MSSSTPLEKLADAIREQVEKEVAPLRKELEHERQLREKLEQQVAKLQKAMSKNAERAEERTADAVREAQKETQRQLENRVEEICSRFLRRNTYTDSTSIVKQNSNEALDGTKRHLNTAQFKREVQDTILEFFNSGDKAEVGRCVRDLQPLSPNRGAEIIRKIMVLAMERSGTECEQSFKLIVYLWRQEDLETRAVEGGFEEMYLRMNDIILDIPDARDMAWSFVVEAKKEGMLPADWSPPDPAELDAQDTRC
mmetsp:Transcript_141914/g.257897  ORF Transcript_141914/g.257897 Transcript_141914/m.257897 type:complete len:253 (-) Transcript_141914:41-799(-)